MLGEDGDDAALGRDVEPAERGVEGEHVGVPPTLASPVTRIVRRSRVSRVAFASQATKASRRGESMSRPWSLAQPGSGTRRTIRFDARVDDREVVAGLDVDEDAA